MAFLLHRIFQLPHNNVTFESQFVPKRPKISGLIPKTVSHELLFIVEIIFRLLCCITGVKLRYKIVDNTFNVITLLRCLT